MARARSGLWMIAVVGVSLVAAECAVAQRASGQAPVATFRGDAAHAGVYAAPTPAAYAGLAWRVQTGGTVVSSPAVTGSAVYIGSNDRHLYALDRVSGRIRWSFDANSAVGSSPTVAGRFPARRCWIAVRNDAIGTFFTSVSAAGDQDPWLRSPSSTWV